MINHYVMNHKDSNKDKAMGRNEVKQFLLDLLDRVDGKKDGGTWINIEVSNIDVGSQVEIYSVIALRDKTDRWQDYKKCQQCESTSLHFIPKIGHFESTEVTCLKCGRIVHFKQ